MTYIDYMFRYLLFLISFSFLLAQNTFAQDNKELLNQANAAYEAKSYAQSITLYEQVLQANVQSVALFNNLGSAYYHKNDMPKSILAYERGLKIDPFNKSIQHNLDLAIEQLDSDIVRIPEFFLSRAWKYVHTRLGSNTWFVLSLLLLLGCVYGFGLWLLHAERQKKKRGFLSGLVLLGLGILVMFLSLSQGAFQSKKDTAIIMQADTPLKSAPEEANEPIMLLNPGIKLFIIDNIGSYDKVQLENGQLGWVAQNSYELI